MCKILQMLILLFNSGIVVSNPAVNIVVVHHVLFIVSLVYIIISYLSILPIYFYKFLPLLDYTIYFWYVNNLVIRQQGLPQHVILNKLCIQIIQLVRIIFVLDVYYVYYTINNKNYYKIIVLNIKYVTCVYKHLNYVLS